MEDIIDNYTNKMNSECKNNNRGYQGWYEWYPIDIKDKRQYCWVNFTPHKYELCDMCNNNLIDFYTKYELYKKLDMILERLDKISSKPN